jgi:hypothetical protein
MAGASLRPAPEMVSARHVHDDRLIAIPIEHPLAPREESEIRDDVVLEHNGLRNLLESPIESAGNALIATPVRF